jgi:hypothetical protein
VLSPAGNGALLRSVSSVIVDDDAGITSFGPRSSELIPIG